MGRWRDSWPKFVRAVGLANAANPLPSWFRAIESSALMGVLADTAAASAGSAGCSFTKGFALEKFATRHIPEAP